MTGAAKQSILALQLYGLLRGARNDDVESAARQIDPTGKSKNPVKPFERKYSYFQ
jgi:hypothetical protein